MVSLHDIASQIKNNESLVEAWFAAQWEKLPSEFRPVYTSTDVRNSGYKISVVDTNLYPAGFNNLCATFSDNGARAFREYFEQRHIKKILILPEEHTRNQFYWKNIATLKGILVKAGLDVRIGSGSTLFSPYPFMVSLEDKGELMIEALDRKGSELHIGDFIPEAILLNNDLSAGIPDFLLNLTQPIIPSPQLGWFRRRKSDHFLHYQNLATDLAKQLALDPWLLFPMMKVARSLDLTNGLCLKTLQRECDDLLAEIAKKYKEHGIERKPYLFIKNNSGTYGLGITHIESGEEVFEWNRKVRNKLESAKGNQEVREYILQEGIPTADHYCGKTIEPVVYLVNGQPIGTFFRMHDQKNDMENLNSPGMSFTCLCYHKLVEDSDCEISYQSREDIFLVSGTLGRVASLAAGFEMKEVSKE